MKSVVKTQKGDGRIELLDVDTSGAGTAVSSGVRVLRRRGRLCSAGTSGRGSLRFPWGAALLRALELTFSLSSSHTSRNAALSLVRSGDVNVGTLATAFALERWEDAFRSVEERRVVEAVLEPSACRGVGRRSTWGSQAGGRGVSTG